MNHHVIVVLTRRGERWRCHCPDFPDLRAEGTSAERLYTDAAQGIRREIMRLRRAGAQLPRFRAYAEIRTDDVWSRQEGIRWPNAIARLVGLPPDLQPVANSARTSVRASEDGSHPAVA